MLTLKESAEKFLSNKRIAVVGVRQSGSDAANLIYRKLRSANYEVFAVNPNADTVEGDTSYEALAAIPNGVDAAVIVLRPERTTRAVHECARLGIQHVWIHKSLGNSCSQEAIELATERGLHIIPGGCPMMFIEPVDIAHKCMYAVLKAVGRIPNVVPDPQTEPASV